MTLLAAKTRGFVMTDAIAGLALVTAMAALLAGAVWRQSGAANRLADSREAMRLAERTMTAIQCAAPLPSGTQGKTVRIRKLQPVNEAPGLAWIAVETSVNGRPAALTGLAKTDSPALRQPP